MKSLPWIRADQIDRIRANIWRYVSPAAVEETVLLEAAALLQMTDPEVLRLGRIHFLLSDEVGRVLAEMPKLARSLATTTALEEEWSQERIRGSIQWNKTFAARAVTGVRSTYVTAPARRAYQTAENELLVFVLDAIEELARKTGWYQLETMQIGREVANRFGQVQRWRQLRALLEVERHLPTPRSIARVRSGRHHRRYSSTLDAYASHRRLIGRLDRAAVRDVIEHRAIVTREDPVLFELFCLFRLFVELEALGWQWSRWGFVEQGIAYRAQRGSEQLQLWYQATPSELRAAGSRYALVQRTHGLAGSELRPDAVLRISGSDGVRWVIVEAKLGIKRSVGDSARAALLDLLGYRRAFDEVLSQQAEPYGIGLAWGADLNPEPGEVLLCSPDKIGSALSLLGLSWINV